MVFGFLGSGTLKTPSALGTGFYEMATESAGNLATF